MPSFSKNDVILVRYPFSNLSGAKIRPAVVVNGPHRSQDLLIVPLTSRASGLLEGEFVLRDWQAAGLNVPTTVKRGVYTVHESLIARRVGKLINPDAAAVESALRSWLGLS